MTDVERFRYLNAAAAVAVDGVLDALYTRRLGALERWSCSDDGELALLEVCFRRSGATESPVRYTRALLSGSADKDPETAGMIFAAAFEERVTTRPPGPAGPDGIAEM